MMESFCTGSRMTMISLEELTDWIELLLVVYQACPMLIASASLCLRLWIFGWARGCFGWRVVALTRP